MIFLFLQPSGGIPLPYICMLRRQLPAELMVSSVYTYMYLGCHGEVLQGQG